MSNKALMSLENVYVFLYYSNYQTVIPLYPFSLDYGQGRSISSNVPYLYMSNAVVSYILFLFSIFIYHLQ